ncbi:hypothetical protein [Pseudomonas graminis]|uniref:hypothetical protein n=1 Tax=Pseudomonas graminis TaxID=158627 RepID=UPI003C1C5E87
MRTITPNDIIAIASESGRSVEEVKQMVEANGWTVADSAKPTRALHNTSDAVAMMKKIKQETISELYQNDSYIREGIDAQYAIERSNVNSFQQKPSNNTYDEAGNFTGMKKSILNGANATVKNQVEAMRAIKADIYKNFNIKENN